MQTFQDVQLEAAPSSSSLHSPALHPPSSAGSSGAVEDDDGDDERGERVRAEISMLSPMQHSTASIAPTHAGSGGAGAGAGNAAAVKDRPDELNIKPFVSTKPLPVSTPSREATLTQKLELALGNNQTNVTS